MIGTMVVGLVEGGVLEFGGINDEEPKVDLPQQTHVWGGPIGVSVSRSDGGYDFFPWSNVVSMTFTPDAS